MELVLYLCATKHLKWCNLGIYKKLKKKTSCVNTFIYYLFKYERDFQLDYLINDITALSPATLVYDGLYIILSTCNK